MIAEETIEGLKDSTSRLFRTLAHFNSSNFNHAPANRWGAGQITEHILLTDISVFRVLQGPLSFAARKTDEKIPQIKEWLSNRDQKIQAPPGIVPSGLLQDVVSMQEKIGRERNSIIQFLRTIDEDSLCIARPNRLFGELTITEWIWFIIYHTDRHIEQLGELET